MYGVYIIKVCFSVGSIPLVMGVYMCRVCTSLVSVTV